MTKHISDLLPTNGRTISIQDIQDAAKRLETIVKPTQLIESQFFSTESQNKVFIKPENLQVTGAFKIRGAFNKLSQLTAAEKARGIIASSAGNHAQGIGLAAQLLGIKATVVMPATTPIIKVEATRSYGANVILAGDNYDEAYHAAKQLEEKHNYVFVHPFDDLDIMLGQGTISLEVLEQLPAVDTILIPIGGGGLAAGMAFAAKMLKPSIKIIGVEPDGANCIMQSLANQQLTELTAVDTIADGAAVKKPGALTFEWIKHFVDEIISVSDFDIAEAILLLIEKHKMITEGAGALSLAGLKKLSSKNKNVVCLISGGNIDILTISAIINKALVFRGRMFCFTVNLPDKPGELLHVANILSSLNANVIKLDHNQSKVVDRFKQVQLEVTVETHGHHHVAEIEAAFEKNGIVIQKIY